VPGPEAAVDVGGVGEAQLLQRPGCQTRLITLIAQQNDAVAEVWCLRMAMLAGRIQPPFQDVACDDERLVIDALPPAHAAVPPVGAVAVGQFGRLGSPQADVRDGGLGARVRRHEFQPGEEPLDLLA